MIVDKRKLIEKIITEIRSFTDIAVVGLSGGVDSLVVATLSMLALGKENVIALHMPYSSVDTKDPLKFNGNSVRISNKLGIPGWNHPINRIADEIEAVICRSFGFMSQVNQGNARSRARMCLLYSVAHHLSDEAKLASRPSRVRVMGTGNLSEDFIGYDTKGGDALADIFPIGELFKSEVYELAEYFVEQGFIDADMIDRNPSAGLWDGQSDEAELGYSYNDMESIIRELLPMQKAGRMQEDKLLLSQKTTDLTKDGIGNFVYKRHFANKHKHEAPIVLELRSLCS